MQPRADINFATEGNPVTNVRHTRNGTTGECLGLHVHIWCPGCQQLHAPRFKCSEHGGPAEGPTWDGDPYSNPFSMEPSLLSHGQKRCHSFIRGGRWEFLGDCEHELRGFYDLEPLPDWLLI